VIHGIIRTRALYTVHHWDPLISPIKHSPQIPSEESGFGGCNVILVAMVAIEKMLVVLMMIMVMVLGTLTQVPFHHDLATLLLALSIPESPTIHKHPFPYFLSMPLPL
jgi:hypothetical protein